MEQIVPVQFGENSGSVLRVQFFQFCQSRLIESADAGLGNRFQQLNQRVPPLLVSELFRQIVCQGLLRVECFRRFFCILHDLGRIGVTYDGVDGPPLGIRKHQRGESGDAVGFFIGFQRSFCLRVLLLFTWVVQFHGNKGTGNGCLDFRKGKSLLFLHDAGSAPVGTGEFQHYSLILCGGLLHGFRRAGTPCFGGAGTPGEEYGCEGMYDCFHGRNVIIAWGEAENGRGEPTCFRKRSCRNLRCG